MADPCHDPAKATDATRPALVLVHGLWMGRWAWAVQRPRFERAGFDVHCFSYPSVRGTLLENRKRLAAYIEQLEATEIHFVGHSLGGVLILSTLAELKLPRVGRIVTLGSPYCGSFVARRLSRWALGRAIVGRTLLDWLSSSGAAHPTWAGLNELGTVIGTFGIGPGLLIAPDLPRPHDGVVSEVEADIPGAADKTHVHVNHFSMLLSRRVFEQSLHFLQTGRFQTPVA